MTVFTKERRRYPRTFLGEPYKNNPLNYLEFKHIFLILV
ncbi:hypothetical protein PLUTE_a3553 [Pseudoalteromonas luteoviolacea DSM 6061]|nr:hypothetical protein [Pseudoalteromonas luteoviolacea DSM 6061]